MGEATTPFVHACDVHVACGEVAGDLDVTDEWGAGSDLSRVRPSETVISGIANEEGSPSNIEIIPGNVHPPVEGRG